jgi:subfamily B ATP-binding cassette protein MsbA
MILVFDKGRIAAQGTHSELIANNPLYRTLYERQSTHSE